MPIYQFVCDTCENPFEVRRSFNDKGVPECPTCNGSGKVRRVFSAPAIVFKGSGFYVNDARGKNSAATKPASTTAESSTPTPVASETKPNKPSSVEAGAN